jgi:response regulator RpfG family c-di-GMP phosphodiesterase
MSDEPFIFAEEENETNDNNIKNKWKIIIADNEEEIHSVTRMVLSNYTFDGIGLELLSAYSGKETKELMRDNPDTAVILLDVVMEKENSGLETVRWIREELLNSFVRIVLRTGQPGQAPEKQVIRDYDINDYKEKTELTDQKLFTTITSSIRSFRDIRIIDRNKRGLEQIIISSAGLFEENNLKSFASGVLTQLTALLQFEESSVLLNSSGFALTDVSGKLYVLAGTGIYSKMEGQLAENVITGEVSILCNQVIKSKKSTFYEDSYIGYFETGSGSVNILFLKGNNKISQLDKELIRIFTTNISVAYENIFLNKEIEDTQKEIITTLGEVVESRSRETGSHVKRVGAFSAFIAQTIGLDSRDVELLQSASPMHDIGKIGIPERIINKPAKLTDEEFEIIKTHTTIGHDILKGSDRSILKAAAVIAEQHHEKWDGSGYPYGLKGEEIHIYGRITAIADVFDALDHKRSYKIPWELKDIIQYFIQNRSTHFDPDLVDVLINNIDSFTKIREMYPD